MISLLSARSFGSFHTPGHNPPAAAADCHKMREGLLSAGSSGSFRNPGHILPAAADYRKTMEGLRSAPLDQNSCCCCCVDLAQRLEGRKVWKKSWYWLGVDFPSQKNRGFHNHQAGVVAAAAAEVGLQEDGREDLLKGRLLSGAGANLPGL